MVDGREWFYYSDDIINFFRDIDKIDLESLPKSPMSERRKYWKLNKLVKNVVYWVSVIPKESKRDYIEKIIEDLGSNLKNIQDILNYIEKDYGSESTLEYRKMIERKETKSIVMMILLIKRFHLFYMNLNRKQLIMIK